MLKYILDLRFFGGRGAGRGGGGHVFNVERQNGRTVYIEAQAGRIKNFERTLRSVDTSLVSLTRTDNLRFSGRARQFIAPAK